MLTLTRPLVTIDTETTGTDPVKDRIIEFGCTVLHPDGSRTKWEQRFNPGSHIPDESTAVHGITDADVADKPPFSEFAVKIHRALQGKDIAGYSLRLLDLPILDEEFRRCGMKLDITGVHVIDAAGIFFKKEPRDLTAAVAKYCGRDHADAHGAGADAEATLDVLIGQMAAYEDVGAMDLADLAALSIRGDKQPADLAGKFYRDADGDLRYAFGKCRDVKVRDDVGFGYWMMRQTSPPFPGNTCDVLQEELDKA